MSIFKDITSQKFGKLTAICPTRKRSGSGNVIWLCQCDCGNLKEVINNNLLSGNVKSCGCLLKQGHGDAAPGKKTRLYRIWMAMKTRCQNPNVCNYKYYGGRGITVWKNWIHDYPNFKKWALINSYQDNLTIDRINNDGSYSPDNCRWITQSENSKKLRPKDIDIVIKQEK